MNFYRTSTSFSRITYLMTVSFVLALFLTSLPLPQWAAWFRPEWSILVLLYWVTRCPDRVGLTTAFVLGLCLDCLYGSVLGVHSLACVIVCYGAVIMSRTLRVHGDIMQILVISFLAIAYQCSLLVINVFLKQQVPYFWAYWAPALILGLCWPSITVLLDRRVVRR